jgi:hypothetical protein
MGVKRSVEGSGEHRRPVYDSYARLSLNPSGHLEKIEDQHEDNLAVIESLGGVLGEKLTDNSLSAWKRGVYRKDWERLLSRVESGECDGCVVWNTDRLLRQPRDLERLIDLGEAGYRVASAHGERNLADPEDRYALRNEAAAAAKHSDLMSWRVKFRFQNQRRRGKKHNQGRSFGWPGRDRTVPRTWDEDGKPEPGPQVPDALVRQERAAIVEGTRAVLAGESQASVAEAWNAAGLRTVHGQLWRAVTVRDVLLRPTNAGRVEHDGELVGRMPGEPIVDEDEYLRLRALYEGRRRGRRPTDIYLASGVVRCGVCGGHLSGRPISGKFYPDGEQRRQYVCSKTRGGCGSVSATMRPVDEELRQLVIARHSDPKHAAAVMRRRHSMDSRLAEVDRELEQCAELQQALSDRLGRRELTLASFDAANEPLAADIARLTTEREQLIQNSPTGGGAVLTEDEAAAQWDAASGAEKRTMLADAIGPNHYLYLDKATRRGPQAFDGDRLRFGERGQHPTAASHLS